MTDEVPRRWLPDRIGWISLAVAAAFILGTLVYTLR
jgi:hypothetical protein